MFIYFPKAGNIKMFKQWTTVSPVLDEEFTSNVERKVLHCLILGIVPLIEVASVDEACKDGDVWSEQSSPYFVDGLVHFVVSYA